MKKEEYNSNMLIEEPSGIDVPQLIFSVKKKYLQFLFFGAIGLLAGLGYNYFSDPKHSFSTSILVSTNNAEATLSPVSLPTNDNKKNSTIQNQIGIISSHALNLQALQNLKWNVSWYEKSFFRNKDLYHNEPFQIIIDSTRIQTKDVPVSITLISGNEYSIECDAVQKLNGAKHDIQFKATARFGKPFVNKYFKFTLNIINGRKVENGDRFELVFNDLGILAQEYQRELKIETGENLESNIIYIQLDSRHSERAIDYLNELTSVYIDYGINEKNRIAKNTVDFINRQIVGISDSLKNANTTFSDYRSDNSILDINQQSSSLTHELGRIQNDESTTKMKLDYVRSLKRYFNNATEMKSLVAPSVVGISDPSLNTQVARLSELLRQREVLSYTAQKQNPLLIALDNEIDFTKKNLNEIVNNLINNTELEFQNIQRQKSNITAQSSSLPKKEQNLINIKRDFDLNNELYTYLLKKKSEAQIVQASRDSDAKVIDIASFDTAQETGLNRYAILLVGLMAGLLIPLIYLTGKTFYRKKLVFVSDVVNLLRLSIVGNITNNKFDNELPVIHYPHSEITESFRGLKINIQYLLNNVENKVIAIHSAVAGEGKTFVSANLAAVLAINNKTVLLVDADLRKPRTYRIFGCDNDIGLADYLQRNASFNDIVVPTNLNGLSIVNAGPKPLFPSELLNDEMLGVFVAEAKKHYEYIIFNNAPIGVVNDAMMIVPFTDMNIFLLRMNTSTRSQINYINRLVQDGVVNNMVVALNNVTNESYRLLGQSSHGYYNDNRLLNTSLKEDVSYTVLKPKK